MEITGYTVGQVLGTTAVTGTFIFFIIKGFINPKANWLTIYTITFIALFILWYLSSPVALYDNILFNAFNAILFLSGVAGCTKYYWQIWKEKKTTAFLNQAFSQKEWLKRRKALSSKYRYS